MAVRKTEKSGAGRKAAVRPDATAQKEFQTIHFGRKNWILFGAGILLILLGFGALRGGSITLAPILLVAGYLVLIPWALIARPRSQKGQGNEEPGR